MASLYDKKLEEMVNTFSIEEILYILSVFDYKTSGEIGNNIKDAFNKVFAERTQER